VRIGRRADCDDRVAADRDGAAPMDGELIVHREDERVGQAEVAGRHGQPVDCTTARARRSATALALRSEPSRDVQSEAAFSRPRKTSSRRTPNTPRPTGLDALTYPGPETVISVVLKPIRPFAGQPRSMRYQPSASLLIACPRPGPTSVTCAPASG